MWLWIKHWRDWVMNDLLPISRIGSQQALHYSYEKAGLRLENQPIAWNAEAVLVEAIVGRLPSSGRSRADFSLHLPGQEPAHPESLRRDENNGPFRIFFRLPPLAQTTTAELYWRDKPMGQVTLPVLQRHEFLDKLSLQMPTLTVNLGRQSVACQSFISTQSRGLMASAMLTGATSLAPVLDLKFEVEFRAERWPATHGQRIPVQMSSSQLRGKQALVTVCPHKFPRRIGPWQATWLLEEQPLATQRVRAISKKHFERSLRISETRFVVQTHKGEVTLTRQPPDLKEIARLGPCFLVSSREVGMAGLCTLQTRAMIPGAVQPPLLLEQEVLITDGPTPFAPGTLDAGDLRQVTGFELCLGGQSLGILPMTPAPTAQFDNEGGFKPAMDFTWSTAAEDQLAERLSRLMDGGRGNGR
jgi:hypothetical protein